MALCVNNRNLQTLLVLSICLNVAVKLIDLEPEDVSANGQMGGEQFQVAHVVDKKMEADARRCSCCCSVGRGGWIQLDLRKLRVLDHIAIKGRSDSKYNFCNTEM